MREVFKKLFLIILVVGTFFCSMGGVSASMIDIEDIETKLTEYFEYSDYEIKFDYDNNTFSLYYWDGDTQNVAITFDFTDEYIEFEDYNTDVENLTESELFANYFVYIIIYSVKDIIYYELSDEYIGYELDIDDDTIDFDENFYETYGILLETEAYDYSYYEEDDNGYVDYNAYGEFIRHFKMSLDTDKIAAIFEKYGVVADNNDDNTTDEDNEILANLVPTIKLSNITTNSVTVSVTVDVPDGYEGTVYCDIEGNAYVDGKIYFSSGTVDCTNGATKVYTDLISGGTYYFKAKVDGGTNYSETLSATLLSTTTNDPTLPANPQLGSKFNIFLLTGISFITLLILHYNKKRSLIHKI